MKKFFFFILGVFFLTSCQYTERFYLNEDGSVRTETEFNLSSFMQMIPALKADSTQQSIKAVDITFDANAKSIDSILPVKEIKKKKDKNFDVFRQNLDKTKVHIKTDSDLFIMNYITTAKDIQELNAYSKKLHQAKTEILEKDTAGTKSSSLQQFYYAKYKYNGKKFQRTLFNQDPFSNGKSKNWTDAQAQEMSKMIKYNLEYHFPKPIEKTSLENATFSADRKILYYSFTLDKLEEIKEQFVDFTVTFKK